MTSSDWVEDLLINSSEAALLQRVKDKFQQLEPLEQGVITYLNLLLYEMSCMKNDVFTALQLFLKAFADERLTNTVG